MFPETAVPPPRVVLNHDYHWRGPSPAWNAAHDDFVSHDRPIPTTEANRTSCSHTGIRVHLRLRSAVPVPIANVDALAMQAGSPLMLQYPIRRPFECSINMQSRVSMCLQATSCVPQCNILSPTIQHAHCLAPSETTTGLRELSIPQIQHSGRREVG